MARPSRKALVRGILRDLVTDIRCARRDGLRVYELECIHTFRAAWPVRFTAKLDAYGWLSK